MAYPEKGVSIILTTYNWPEALVAVLKSFNFQTDKDFELIIADDGSRQQTTDTIKELLPRLNYPVKHVWQADEGFQTSKIFNKCAAQTTYSYIIFMNGDCMVMPNFVENHKKMAEKGYFVDGQRVLLSEQFTKDFLSKPYEKEHSTRLFWLKQKFKGLINRFLPFYTLPLGFLRKISPKRWKGVMTCNLAIWKDDFYKINGFDESYVGWGYEDSDLVIRLIRSGVKRKTGRFAVPVLHLWHKESDRSNEPDNRKRLNQILTSTHIRSAKGAEQYMDDKEISNDN